MKPHLDHALDPRAVLIFLAILAGGLFYMAYSIYSDVSATGGGPTTILPFLLLGVAMVIALGFEFVNGFHDTANAVATVIYTHALPAQGAVVWSGCWNLLGVLASSGAVAFGIVSLLPVELILQVGSSAGYAMVFAALMRGRDGASGVDWDQVVKIGEALLFSPLFSFALSAVLLLLMKFIVRAPQLYQAPTTNATPPLWIRGLLVLTCTLVSFFHGSNDGQKGMGLIMLILIGVVPTAYALNRAPPVGHTDAFIAAAHNASKSRRGPRRRIQRDRRSAPGRDRLHPRAPDLGGHLSVARSAGEADQRLGYGSVAKTPLDKVQNVRNDMYLASEALRVLSKDKESELSAEEKRQIGEFKKQLDYATKFIPLWVKVCVAIALGLGTMILNPAVALADYGSRS